MSSFQRARTDEQRAERRAAILDAAAVLAMRQGVRGASLNEIARQAGLAKSNVLRYFESREAILLSLLATQYLDWTDEVARVLPFALETLPEERVATVVASTILERPLLCDLVTASPAVLEANMSAVVALDHRSSMIRAGKRLLEALGPVIGDLDLPEGKRFILALHAFVAMAWTSKTPSPGMAAAWQEHPELRFVSVDPENALREMLTTFLLGMKVRRAQT